MIEDVREAFASAVQELDWMDSTTRHKTLNKLRAIRNFVGFPAWLLTKEQLDKHYKHVSFIMFYLLLCLSCGFGRRKSTGHLSQSSLFFSVQ